MLIASEAYNKSNENLNRIDKDIKGHVNNIIDTFVAPIVEKAINNGDFKVSIPVNYLKKGLDEFLPIYSEALFFKDLIGSLDFLGYKCVMESKRGPNNQDPIMKIPESNNFIISWESV